VASFEVRPSTALEHNSTARNNSMGIARSNSTREPTIEEMQEAKKKAVTVSRRSTRLFVEEQQMMMGSGNTSQTIHDLRYLSGDEKERERDKSCRETVSPSISMEVRRVPMVELGKDLSDIFPKTEEEIEKQGMADLMLVLSLASIRTQ